MLRGWRTFLGCAFAVAQLGSTLLAAAPWMNENERTHDPSTIIRDGGEYWVFATGRGILSRRSKDLIHWQPGPRVFRDFPAWTSDVVRDHRGFFWAPDVIQHNGQFLLYYSVSQWGKRTSAIGLATNPALDPSAPNYLWTDRGIVIQTSERNDFNAIDPNVTRDAAGNLWMVFGSYWSGIKLIQLDPTTDLRLATNSPVHSLAWSKSIEAACITRHDDSYFLFVNWGQCCQGTNSTYEIRVGRSPAITGPYLDKQGVDMLRGGGTAFLASSGPAIGPGHAAVFSERGTNWFSYHYYIATNRGIPALAVRQLLWTTDGWPTLKN